MSGTAYCGGAVPERHMLTIRSSERIAARSHEGHEGTHEGRRWTTRHREQRASARPSRSVLRASFVIFVPPCCNHSNSPRVSLREEPLPFQWTDATRSDGMPGLPFAVAPLEWGTGPG